MYAELEMQHAELKKSQDELEIGNRKLNQLIDKSPFGMALLDEDAQIVFINNTFKTDLASHGVNRPGVNLRFMLAPEMQDVFEHYFRLVKSKSVFQTTTLKFDNHAGQINWFKVSAELFDKAVGKKIYLTVYEDITEHVQAQKKLDETNLILQTVANQSVDIIAIYDLELNIQWISQSVERSGLKANEMIGRNLLQYVYTDDHNVIVNAVQNLNDRLDIGVAEYRFVNSAGEIFWCEATGKVLSDDQGKPERLLVISRVNNVRKAAEKALKESFELQQQANQTKDKLFSIIAHDLRSPFNSILSLAEMMSVDDL